MIRRVLRLGLERVESGFDAVYGAQWNPCYYLGALGWFLFWIILASGIYVYAFFDSGVEQAYRSVEYLTHVQWYAGGIMRSLHRYASDMFVVVVLAHLVRQWIKGNYKDARWFAWVTGVPLLWLMYASGISGYWIVWDELAQYVALTTTQWLDTLPLFGEPIARNFLHPSTLSGRFFTLMVFIHIAVPLTMLFLMWVHIQRHMYPRVNPPLGLLIGTFAMLLVLSLAYPAVSQNPADLHRVVGEVGLDWFYLPVYPLVDMYPGEVLWALLGGVTLVLIVLPFLPPRHTAHPAVVNLDNCNGCGRCVADCPYSAVSLRPRTDGASYSHEAVVTDAKCVSCGICVGACPTATPFRRRSSLVPGIDLPDLSALALRENLVERAAALSASPRVLVVGCGDGVAIDELAGPGVAVMSLSCVGHLPPPFLDFLISRGYVDGVFVTGCREGDCEYRLGQQWTEARLRRERDPRLRERVPDERIQVFWAGRDRARAVAREVAAFRAALGKLAESAPKPAIRRRAPRAMHRGRRLAVLEGRFSKQGAAGAARLAAQALVYAAFALFIGFFSVSPTYTQFEPSLGVITLSFSHAGEPETECRRRTQAQLEELAPNMRKAMDCPRRRVPLLVELELDGEQVYRASLPPSGVAGDGASTVYQEFPVPAGRYDLTARLRDSRGDQGFDWHMSRVVEIEPRENVVIDFRAETGGFKIL